MEVKVTRIKKNIYKVNGMIVFAQSAKNALQNYVSATMGGAKVVHSGKQ